MHPPAFDLTQRLLDWPDCKLEFRCACGRITQFPTKLMAAKHGNRTFRQILKRAKCKQCNLPPDRAWLCAGESPRTVYWQSQQDTGAIELAVWDL